MPQSERSNNLKKIVAWLLTEEKATTSKIIHHIKWEITEGGATDNTCKKYIKDLDKAGIIRYNHPYWTITEYGKKWLDKHGV